MAIQLTDDNIRDYVEQYLDDPTSLPPQLRNISQWDVSRVTDMEQLFGGAEDFNEPLNDWDVSNVIDMSAMFSDTRRFNQPLDRWNVSNVRDMDSMFSGARMFDQELNNWDVHNVLNMNYMFQGARAFNRPLDRWNITNVREAEDMFDGARNFNERLPAGLLGRQRPPGNGMPAAAPARPAAPPGPPPGPQPRETYETVHEIYIGVSADSEPTARDTGFNPVDGDQQSVIRYLDADPKNIAFKFNNAYFLSNKNIIENNIVTNPSNIKYECIEVGTLRPENIRPIPYLSLNAIGINGAGVAPLSRIKNIILTDRIRVIKVVNYTVSPILPPTIFASMVSLEALGEDPEAHVGTDHCQEGQSQTLHMLQEIRYTEQTGGKRKRGSRRRNRSKRTKRVSRRRNRSKRTKRSKRR